MFPASSEMKTHMDGKGVRCDELLFPQ